MLKNLLSAFFLCLAISAQAQYSETFTGQNGKGLVNAICAVSSTLASQCGSSCTAGAAPGDLSGCTVIPPDFTGVDWNIIATTFFTDGSGFGFDYTSPDDFGVVGEKIQVNDPDQEICWVSPVINIASAVGDVTISVDEITQSGGLESGDFIRGDYRINGVSWNQFGFAEGAFTTPTSFSVSGLSGNTLEIRICAKTNGSSEIITFDNISVPNSGVTTGCNPPMVSVQTTQAGSCNSINGTIKVTASGGTPGYNVAWSGPSSGNPGGIEIASSGGMYTITSLTPGTYTITVTDAATCTATTTATITTAAALSLSTQALDATCSSVNDGEIDLSVSNGVPPYSYSWNNLPTPGDPQDQTGLAPGTYTVTVTDNAGCTASTSATVGVSTPGAYLETFSIAGKGILDGSTCSGSNGTTCTNNNFAGVNWSIYGLSTLSGVDANDYFKTTGGKLEHKDIDQDVCWESPEIDINPPGSGIAFSVDLAWNSFDQEPSPDYIDVEYSIDGGGWARVPNQVGGSATHTIGYINGSGNDLNGSTTVSVSALSGSTLRIRVCGLGNIEDETFTIDNVSVPGSNGVYCPCPTITFTATPTNTCPGSSNGQIAVTGVTGGAGPYMYSKNNGATFQSGSTFTGLAAGMYDVVVKDVNACVSAATQVTVGAFSAPACSVSGPDFVCNSTENNVYSATGGMSAYSWGISSGGSIPGSTTGSSVSVTSGNYLDDYTVSVTVTDANGCTSSCSKQSFIYLAKPPADITANPNPVCFGATLDLSISAAASSTVSWTGEGINNPSGNPSTTADPTTTGPHVYSVMVTTNPAGCTNTGTVNVTVENCNIDFSGKIIWEHDDVSGVKDATVNLTGSATGSDLTDINGDFMISTGLTSGSFTLKPVKTLNKYNGVTAGDATAIQQHVTLINPITDPYKLVCADVNKNNVVNTLDASIITQALLGNPAANAQFKTSWRFVPSDYALSVPPWGFPEQRTYTGISGPQTNQDFIGMKIGDVTGDANPANLGSSQPMVLRANDRVLQSGETVNVTLSADQLDDLAAFQFGLNFDPAQMQFESVEPAAGSLPLTADNFGLYNVVEGEIRAVWSQPAGLRVEESAPVFHLRFTALQSGAKLSEALQLDDAVLPGLAYNSKLAESTVELRFSEATGTNDPAASVLNMQVRPNPLRDATTVSFHLPEGCDAQLRVLDVNGRELLRINNTYPAGNNSEMLRLEGIAATGVLTCELVTPFGVATRKMVVAR